MKYKVQRKDKCIILRYFDKQNIPMKEKICEKGNLVTRYIHKLKYLISVAVNIP